MILLNTDSYVTKVPTRFVPADADDDLDEFATMVVSFNDIDHLCKVLSPYAARLDRGINTSEAEQAEWLELVSNHGLVMRSASLYAVPATDVLGTGRFALGMIDLCLDDTSETRYFVHAVAID